MLDAGPVAITLLGATARPELDVGAPPGGRQYDLTSEDRSDLGGAPCPTIGAGCVALAALPQLFDRLGAAPLLLLGLGALLYCLGADVYRSSAAASHFVAIAGVDHPQRGTAPDGTGWQDIILTLRPPSTRAGTEGTLAPEACH
jgi:hypothetical protein